MRFEKLSFRIEQPVPLAGSITDEALRRLTKIEMRQLVELPSHFCSDSRRCSLESHEGYHFLCFLIEDQRCCMSFISELQDHSFRRHLLAIEMHYELDLSNDTCSNFECLQLQTKATQKIEHCKGNYFELLS